MLRQILFKVVKTSEKEKILRAIKRVREREGRERKRQRETEPERENYVKQGFISMKRCDLSMAQKTQCF